MPPLTSQSHTLFKYLEDEEDYRIARHQARHSKLPHSDLYRDVAYLGRDPSNIGTSRLVNGTGITTNASLPCLVDSKHSISTSSIPTSVGERAADNSFRAIVEERDGNNGVYNDLCPYPVLRRPQVPSLQCPFIFLPCLMVFSLSHIDEWIAHSLQHFSTDERVPRLVEPPTSNACPFCGRPFIHHSGFTSWTLRMKHVAFHHEIGHTLAHSRPDFALYQYLWSNRVIDTVAYKELRGNTVDGSRLISGQNSPSISTASTPRADSDDDEPPRTFTVLNERSRPRRPDQP